MPKARNLMLRYNVVRDITMGCKLTNATDFKIEYRLLKAMEFMLRIQVKTVKGHGSHVENKSSKKSSKAMNFII